MQFIRISKEFTFETAHALTDHPGKCAGLHGHSYHLTVTIGGRVIDSAGNGMVMDFGELKNIVHEKVLNLLDHAVVLQKDHPLCAQMKDQHTRLVQTDYEPTCENLLVDMASKINGGLPAHVQLFSLKLRETATSYAEWFSSDNK